TSQKFEVYEGMWQNMLSSGGGAADNLGNGVASTVITSITGTASTPSITFSGDTDTGFSNAGTNRIAASTGGTERVRIDEFGNIGVGTATPSYQLDVAKPARIGGTVIGATVGTNLYDDGFGNTYVIAPNSNGSVLLGVAGGSSNTLLIANFFKDIVYIG